MKTFLNLVFLLFAAEAFSAETRALASPVFVRVQRGAKAPIKLGLKDTLELVARKELLNHLAFKAVTAPNEVEAYVYPDANGDGQLTINELEALLGSPLMEGTLPNGSKFSRWLERLKQVFEAMVTPDNPAHILAPPGTADIPALNVTNTLPRIIWENGDGKITLSAKRSYRGLVFDKVPTDAAVGNRYVSMDMNGDKILTLGEVRKFYQHPAIQDSLSKTGMLFLQAWMSTHAGYMTRAHYGKMMNALHQSGDVGSEELRTVLNMALEKCLKDTSQDNKILFSVEKFEQLNASGSSANPQKPSPCPTILEAYSPEHGDAFWGLGWHELEKNSNASALPSSLRNLKISDEVPRLDRKERESVEQFMARFEYQSQTHIPVGSKFVDLDNDGNGVLEHQEIMDNLNFLLNGKHLGDLLPESVKAPLITVANLHQLKPASRERMIEIMQTRLLDVKAGASNEAILKVLDVDANKTVTIGEFKYQQMALANQ